MPSAALQFASASEFRPTRRANDRANAARRILESTAISVGRIVEVTGYDFQTLDLNLLNIVTATIGPKNMPATGPHCPNLPIVPIEVPACQGLQAMLASPVWPSGRMARLPMYSA